MRRSLPVHLCLCLLVAGRASAQQTDAPAPGEEVPTFARVGGYLTAGGFYNVESFSSKGNFLGAGPVEVDDSAHFDLRAGVRAHPHAAVELHLQLFEFDVDSDSLGGGEVSGWIISVDGKGYLLTGRIQPYALLGLGYLDAEGDGFLGGSSQDFAARFGGGVDLDATPNWAVSAETSYVLPTGDVDDLDYVSIGAGVMLRF